MKIIKKIACLFLLVGMFYQYTQASDVRSDRLSDDEVASLLASGALGSTETHLNKKPSDHPSDMLSDDEVESLLALGALGSDEPASPHSYFTPQDELLQQATNFWNDNYDQINRIGELERATLTQEESNLFEQALDLGTDLLQANILSQFSIQYTMILPAALSSVTTIQNEPNNERLESLKNKSQLLLQQASCPISLSPVKLTSLSPILFPADHFESLMSSSALESKAPLFKQQDQLLQQATTFWDNNNDKISRFGESSKTQLTSDDALLIEQALTIGENLVAENLLPKFSMQYEGILPAAVSNVTKIQDEANDQRLEHLNSRLQILSASLLPVKSVSSSPVKLESTDRTYLLTQAKQVARNISRPVLDDTQPDLMTIGTIETVDQYLRGYASYRNLATITENLMPCDSIINSRGDGNCGYRAFYASLLMNATQSGNRNIIPYLQRILQEKYVSLFEQYNLNFTNYQNSMAQAILNYLLEQLNNLNRCQNLDEVRNILNNEYAFDYYMIMFLRYLLMEYIHQNDGDAFTMVIKASRDDNLNEILTWGIEIENVEMYLFARILQISIYTLAQNSIDNIYIRNESLLPETGFATILYVPGHYRIFIPASYQQDILHQIFKEVGKSSKTQKIYANAQAQAQAFWTDQENLDEIIGLQASNSKYELSQKPSDRPEMLSAHRAHLVEEAIEIGNRLLQEGSLHNFAQQYTDLSNNVHYAIRIHEESDPTKIFTLKEQLAHLAELAHNPQQNDAVPAVPLSGITYGIIGYDSNNLTPAPKSESSSSFFNNPYTVKASLTAAALAVLAGIAYARSK